MEIRRGDLDDVPVLLGLYDEAVEWMVARGNTEQWGTEPFSTDPQKVSGVQYLVRTGDLWLAEIDGEPVGALIVNDRPPPSYGIPADEPELYVNLLLVSRRHAGRKIGTALLDFARDEARARGVSLMRLDCYAGGTGELIRYYTRHGFTPTETYRSIDGWPGQFLEQRI
jgi:GNAT superfamily N-acetyltransferase